MLETIKEKKSKSIEVIPMEEKLYMTNFCPDTESHIKTNPDICRICPGKECTVFCPSNVFMWSNIDDSLVVAYENCLECGACASGCPYEAIDYANPKAGYGMRN